MKEKEKIKLDKKLVDELKNNIDQFENFISSANNQQIKYVLDKLGKLENDYLTNSLITLLKHEDDIIRTLAVKNLAKINKHPSKIWPKSRKIVSWIVWGRFRRQIAPRSAPRGPGSLGGLLLLAPFGPKMPPQGSI